MTRATFIKNLISTFGFAVLPEKMITHYKRIYLLQSFIRGFRFYEGPQLLERMKEGNLLELVRERKNPHDACAIALHFNNHKIGYIPRENNELLSRLLDADVIEMTAEITHLKPEAAAWENIYIAVYILKNMKNTAFPKHAAYLTSLDSPRYHTIKYQSDRISRISYHNQDHANDTQTDYQMDGEAFYAALAENSDSDEIYTVIHTGFLDTHAMEDAVSNNEIIIDREKLPEDLKADMITRPLDNLSIELNDAFDEKGYVVANINRLATLSSRIKRFTEVFDKSGNRFFEVVLKP